MEKVCYSVLELGAVLGIGRNGAYALVHQEGFPAVKLGKRIVIPVDALHEWLKKNGKIVYSGGEQK